MPRVKYFEQDEVFPIVAKVIEQFCERSDDYAPHDVIVCSLLRDPDGSRLVGWASRRAKFFRDTRSQDWTLEEWAANMVAWFSEKYTTRELPSAWLDRFERGGKPGNYSYRVRRSG